MRVVPDRACAIAISEPSPRNQKQSRTLLSDRKAQSTICYGFRCYNWRQPHASLKVKTLIG